MEVYLRRRLGDRVRIKTALGYRNGTKAWNLPHFRERNNGSNNRRGKEFNGFTYRYSQKSDGSLDRRRYVRTRSDKVEVFQTAAEQNGCYALNLSAIGRRTQNNCLQEIANSTPAWQALHQKDPARHCAFDPQPFPESSACFYRGRVVDPRPTSRLRLPTALQVSRETEIRLR
jgi:hypothetical protein